MYMNEIEIRFSAKKDLFGGSWGGCEHIYIYANPPPMDLPFRDVFGLVIDENMHGPL